MLPWPRGRGSPTEPETGCAARAQAGGDGDRWNDVARGTTWSAEGGGPLWAVLPIVNEHDLLDDGPRIEFIHLAILLSGCVSSTLTHLGIVSEVVGPHEAAIEPGTPEGRSTRGICGLQH